MRFASAMIMLLYFGSVTSADGMSNETLSMPRCSDNSGLLRLLMNQINERVTTMGAEIRVLKAQTIADAQTLSQLEAEIPALRNQTNADAERLSQMGAEIRVLKAQSTADAETLSQMGAEIPALRNQRIADAETLSQMGAEMQLLNAQSTADAETLQTITRQLEQTPNDTAASTFVRWGSSTCGNTSSLVYNGVVGGGGADNEGSAANHLCLTLSPRLVTQALPTRHAPLLGAEYQTFDAHNNRDPVCAVCSAAFSTTVMIPGTDTCTPGWSRQYDGFLMSGRADMRAATEYICVDRELEEVPDSGRNDDGRLLFFAITKCGSLPCGPYANDKYVTCAVCSK